MKIISFLPLKVPDHALGCGCDTEMLKDGEGVFMHASADRGGPDLHPRLLGLADQAEGLFRDNALQVFRIGLEIVKILPD